MTVGKIPCNQCGALIDVPGSANYVTCGSCNTPLAVRRTGSSLYTERVLGPTEIATPETAEKIAIVSTNSAGAESSVLAELGRQNELNRLENELNRLDLDWDRAKEQFMISGRNGVRYLPTKSSSVGGGIMVAVFGVIWTSFACGITGGFSGLQGGDHFGSPPIIGVVFPLFGLLFIGFGIFTSMNAYNKASQYEGAQHRYMGRRRELLDKIDSVRSQLLG